MDPDPTWANILDQIWSKSYLTFVLPTGTRTLLFCLKIINYKFICKTFLSYVMT